MLTELQLLPAKLGGTAVSFDADFRRYGEHRESWSPPTRPGASQAPTAGHQAPYTTGARVTGSSPALLIYAGSFFKAAALTARHRAAISPRGGSTTRGLTPGRSRGS
jgi:hypothetical protein